MAKAWSNAGGRWTHELVAYALDVFQWHATRSVASSPHKEPDPKPYIRIVPQPQGSAQIPEPRLAEGPLAFAVRLARDAHVALVENRQRILQATRQIRRFLGDTR